jgi:membrane associated rhomboid family serine protease
VVLPVHDINPLRRRPYVTWALVAVNVVVFVLLEPVTGTLRGTVSACTQTVFFEKWGAVPALLLHPHASIQFVDCTAHGGWPSRYLTPLTGMFLHGGWVHLAGNMIFLVVFGNNVEDRMGRLPFLAFYVFCGYAAAYGQAAIDPHSTAPLIGASGAIAGVLGAYIVLFPRARVVSLLTFFFFLPVRLPAWIVLGFWFLLQWLYSQGVGVAGGSDVAYTAHVAGFLVGALITLGLRKPLLGEWGHHQPPPGPRSERAYSRMRQGGWW